MKGIFAVFDEPSNLSILRFEFDDYQTKFEGFFNRERHIPKGTAEPVFRSEVWKMRTV